MGDRKISQASELLNWKSIAHNDARIDMKEETYASSQEDIKRLQSDSIMKRIPKGAEATTVLVSFILRQIAWKGICLISFLFFRWEQLIS